MRDSEKKTKISSKWSFKPARRKNNQKLPKDANHHRYQVLRIFVLIFSNSLSPCLSIFVLIFHSKLIFIKNSYLLMNFLSSFYVQGIVGLLFKNEKLCSSLFNIGIHEAFCTRWKLKSQQALHLPFESASYLNPSYMCLNNIPKL